MPRDLWSAEADGLGALDLLVYRSRLLGSDRAIVNYGGGNTSAKTREIDHTGREVEVIWIKGSGSDLATISRHDFTPLRLAEIRPLAGRDEMSDDDMVEYLAHCAFRPGAPRPSIETLLHAFLPARHVDHTHPEAALAFCCAADGESPAKECFGERLVWVPYVRPGFRLAKLAKGVLEANPSAHGMLLSKHGLVTWGETARESYTRTIEVLRQAEDFLTRGSGSRAPFGGARIPQPSTDRASQLLTRLLPIIRGELSRTAGSSETPSRPLILHADRSPEVIEFAGSRLGPELAQLGAACPDHVMYTRFRPAVLDAEECLRAFEAGDSARLEAAARTAIREYVDQYRRWFEANGEAGVEMLDPGPRVMLVPGLGIIAAGRDSWSAGNVAGLFRSAVRVMRWAGALSSYASLSPKEAWEIEYWPLELYKLTLRPPEGELSGRIALITGGAGAIGRATAKRLLEADAHVVIADIDGDRAEEVVCRLREELADRHRSRVTHVRADAGDAAESERMFEEAVLAFGGVDVVVPNAGIASAAPIDEVSPEEWDAVHRVLVRGCFLTCRQAFAVLKRQEIGGSIVVNASKNGLAAAKHVSAYASAKAAELHMMRCLAEEGGAHGIRVNAVSPDAVIEGSGLWTKEWRESRARAYGFAVEDLEEFYRRRNVLQVKVTAEDVAEAILFLAGPRSAKTTGSVLPVDGGVASAYPR